MSDHHSRWEPGRDPVHRLLHHLDVLAIAFNRFRQLSFRLPVKQEGTTPDPDSGPAFLSERSRLLDDLDAVRDAVYRSWEWTTPTRFAERLADEAVAAFARRGAATESASRAVAGAAEWVGGVVTKWAVGAARPWDYYSVELLPPDGRRPVRRFDTEAAVLDDYRTHRRALLAALAVIGETIPPAIDRRAQLAFHTWPRTDSDPVTQNELLALAREADPAPDRAVPPAGDPAAPAAPGARAWREDVDAVVAEVEVNCPPGLDPELTRVVTAVAAAVRECVRLVVSIPHLYEDEAEFLRLTGDVAGATAAAQIAYRAVEVRVRRAGGDNPTRDVLSDLRVFLSQTQHHSISTPGGLGAILTHLHSRWAERFNRIEWRGFIDPMLDQLVRIPPPTEAPPPAAGGVEVRTNTDRRELPAQPAAGAGKRVGRPKLSESSKPAQKARGELYRMVQSAMSRNPRLRSAADLLAYFKQPEQKDFRQKLEGEVGVKVSAKFVRAALKWVKEHPGPAA